MKIYPVLLGIAVTFLLSGGNPKNVDLPTKILGEWKSVSSISESDNHRPGLSFSKNNSCEVKLGYFKTVNHPFLRRFYGTLTKYKIENDSLRIFNPSNSTWDVFQIVSIESDVLKLRKTDGSIESYDRTTISAGQTPAFDQIVVSSSGCDGTCPVSQTSVRRDGSVLFYGDGYNLSDGFYQFSITTQQFNHMAEGFRKASVLKLHDSYVSPWTDDETITTTFINKGRIVKSVVDYGRAAPAELNWAYTPVRYLYQQAHLNQPNAKNSSLFFRSFGFIDGNKTIQTLDSENFFLLDLIRHAKETKVSFQKKYALDLYSSDSLASLETDGRYYLLTWKNGKEKRVDLGYNFLVENGILRRSNKNSTPDIHLGLQARQSLN